MSARDFPHLALSAHAHNRLGLQRTDDAWFDRQWQDPSTRVLVMSGSRLRPVDGAPDWRAPAEVPATGTRVLLGEHGGVVHAALILPAEQAPGDPSDWVPLRAVLPALAGEASAVAPLLLHAVGLAEWHFATRFCPRCGGALESRAAGHELRCSACGRAQFPRTDPAVIMAITHGEPGSDDEALLLGRQPSWPADRWSTLAGFVEPGETFEDAVRREVAEEAGVAVGEVTYFGNQPWPLPASLMIGFFGRATDPTIDVDGAEIEDARWFTRAGLREVFASGEVAVPRSVSISSSLIQHWYGDDLGRGWH